MAWLVLPYFIPYFFYLLVFHFPSYSSSLVPLCSHEESYALVQFNNSFTLNSSASAWLYDCDQSSYPKTASWRNGTNCCLWNGVTCDAKSGHVIGLDLSCSWLQGELHPNNTLFQLTHLQRLNLAFNRFGRYIHSIEYPYDFFESQMFSEFGDLVSLTHLNLSYSGFDGVIPSKLSHLSKLVSLDLSQSSLNYLRFEPSTWEMLVLNATGLRELYLNGVNMSSITPSSLSSLLMNLSSSLVSLDLGDTDLRGNLTNNILCLPNLQKLDLSWNFNLQGELPKSNWSTPLSYLNLMYTPFSGEIPNSIGHLKSLTLMDLSYCNLNGQIPLSLGNLTRLTSLNLRWNNFSGEIPSLISNLQHLNLLDLSSCSFEGPIPLPLLNLTKLTDLYLSDNNLNGKIPPSISNLQHLTGLGLSSCNFRGPMTLSLSNMTQLIHLDLAHNSFRGEIPNSICKLSNLISLDLSGNLLNGTIPQECFSSPSIQELHLDDNQLTGPIGEFSTYSLEGCYLSNNKLQGHIPNSIFSLSRLFELDLSSNNISGFVDFHQFSRLPQLQSLELSNNNFLSLNFDNIVNDTFPYLEELSLSSCNMISFPKFLARLQNLQLLDLSHNKIHGRIPTWLNEHISLWNIPFIDLSFNLLQGNVPIPSFGNQVFLVSNNKFTGEIPSTICNASSLIVIDLSHNYLTGMIPHCLGTFSSLAILDLQMNNFHGIIPRNFSRRNALETQWQPVGGINASIFGPLPRTRNS